MIFGAKLLDRDSLAFLCVVIDGVFTGERMPRLLVIVARMRPHHHLVGALDFREVLKDLAGGDALQCVDNLYGRNGGRRVEKEMHMIGLHIERADDPGVCFADAADSLFNECSKLAYQNLFAVFRIPDKMMGELVGDIFGVLPIHTRQHNRCSNILCSPRWGRLTPT